MNGPAKEEAGSCRVEVFLGIGSNLQQPLHQLRRACGALKVLPHSKDMRCSPLYLNPPMGPRGQPDYINGVVRLVTQLPPEALLWHMQRIEQAQGRKRGERWGARTLDLDLLVYGDLVLNTPELKIPHPGLVERAFVLCPLHDLAPELRVPGLGSVAELLTRIDTAGLVRIRDEC